jgi:hypothetical protein
MGYIEPGSETSASELIFGFYCHELLKISLQNSVLNGAVNRKVARLKTIILYFHASYNGFRCNSIMLALTQFSRLNYNIKILGDFIYNFLHVFQPFKWSSSGVYFQYSGATSRVNAQILLPASVKNRNTIAVVQTCHINKLLCLCWFNRRSRVLAHAV